MGVDRNDLTAFRGMVEKPRSEGGVGKKKPNRKRASPARIAEVREKKLAGGCRVCSTVDNLHAHHVVRRGAPYFGTWTESNIIPLCEACHRGYHDGDDRVKKIIRWRLTKAEVEYGDDKAYLGFVDDAYWPLPKVGRNELTAVGAEIAPAGETA